MAWTIEAGGAVLAFLLLSPFILHLLTYSYSTFRQFITSRGVHVNCWFCNKNFVVKKEFANCWTCPECENYNGFTENGDYNRVIPEMYNNIQSKRIRSNNQNNRNHNQSNNSLCNSCNNLQTLKIHMLAAFEPGEGVDEDQAYQNYQQELERRYPLCFSCQNVVQSVVSKENRRLKSLMMHQGLRKSNPLEIQPKTNFVSLTFLPTIKTSCTIIQTLFCVYHLFELLSKTTLECKRDATLSQCLQDLQTMESLFYCSCFWTIGYSSWFLYTCFLGLRIIERQEFWKVLFVNTLYAILEFIFLIYSDFFLEVEGLNSNFLLNIFHFGIVHLSLVAVYFSYSRNQNSKYKFPKEKNLQHSPTSSVQGEQPKRVQKDLSDIEKIDLGFSFSSQRAERPPTFLEDMTRLRDSQQEVKPKLQNSSIHGLSFFPTVGIEGDFQSFSLDDPERKSSWNLFDLLGSTPTQKKEKKRK